MILCDESPLTRESGARWLAHVPGPFVLVNDDLGARATLGLCASVSLRRAVPLYFGVESSAIGHVSKHGPRSIACVQV